MALPVILWIWSTYGGLPVFIRVITWEKNLPGVETNAFQDFKNVLPRPPSGCRYLTWWDVGWNLDILYQAKYIRNCTGPNSEGTWKILFDGAYDPSGETLNRGPDMWSLKNPRMSLEE